MIVVCLRLVFNGVYNFNWGWTRAVHFASESVNLRKSTVFRYANDYLDPDNADIIWPRETQMKMRGRGSEAFINNHGRDKYSALKEVLVFLLCLFVHNTILRITCILSHAGTPEGHSRVRE